MFDYEPWFSISEILEAHSVFINSLSESAEPKSSAKRLVKGKQQQNSVSSFTNWVKS